MKILIFGASGSGTTTLGIEIEKQTQFKHLDADYYYWKKTNPPFQEKVELQERNKHLKADFNRFENLVISGSLVSWGKEWETSFDLAIFIRLENQLRMDRLKRREEERYGARLIADKAIRETSKAFLEWANQYENPHCDGRSLKTHKNWMKLLNCKTLTIDGKAALKDKIDIVLNEIESYNNNL